MLVMSGEYVAVASDGTVEDGHTRKWAADDPISVWNKLDLTTASGLQ
jgi:hypothetical protein